uniref:Peptidase S26B, signal peptidase (SEC11, sipW) n=1 Tax=uncultured marine thaumarchaeote KM3_65_A09 TaxID=1456223 RepID=A0A075HBP5_9ARCH|nr:peptidase S26B, signal peptidase (SEC11, sipW) [uncultured marine thaumarchaeote KM3_65_A09]
MSSIKGIVKDIIIVAACVAVIWIGLTAYFGAQNPFYVVSSGSMYPELAMHDIIVISGHASFADVKIGDIIVFDKPQGRDKVIVHRVVAVVDDDPLTLRTKGDNNQHSMVGTDYPITEEEYIGTVIHVIPQVGYITQILQPPINYIIIVVIIGIMIIRQISKNKKEALVNQMKTESEINDSNESQSNENVDQLPKDVDYSESKDFATQEKKSTEKLGDEEPKHDIDSLLDDLKRDAGKTKIDDN